MKNNRSQIIPVDFYSPQVRLECPHLRIASAQASVDRVTVFIRTYVSFEKNHHQSLQPFLIRTCGLTVTQPPAFISQLLADYFHGGKNGRAVLPALSIQREKTMLKQLLPLVRKHPVSVMFAFTDKEQQNLRVTIHGVITDDKDKKVHARPIVFDGTSEEFISGLPELTESYVAKIIPFVTAMEVLEREQDTALKNKRNKNNTTHTVAAEPPPSKTEAPDLFSAPSTKPAKETV